MEELKNIGDDFFNKNMFEEAIEKYTLALDLDSDDKYKIYLNRCLSFYKLKKYNKALSDAIKATRLKPDNAKSWGRLGSCLSALGRKSQAVYAFKKAYGLEPLNQNYKIESNKEIDLNNSDTEEEYDKEDEDKYDKEDEKNKKEEKEKQNTINYMPTIDSMLNNKMVNNDNIFILKNAKYICKCGNILI